jgi:hypothetical protein
MRTRVATIIAILAVGSLSLTACGGGNDSNNNENDDDQTVMDTGVDENEDTGSTDEDTNTIEDTGGTDEDGTSEKNDSGTSDDAGTDEDTGGGEDAGSSDDAGPSEDTNTSDTGMNDTGSNDTGMRDSGTPDGGSTDAGSRDGGMNDTGTNDGGTNDAGSMDGGSMDGGTTMEMSIRDIRNQAQNLQPGKSLSGTFDVDGVVVTAVETGSSGDVEGVYVQEPSGPKANSGIWVFFGNATVGSIPALTRGNVIDLEGEVTNYDSNQNSQGGLLELFKISSIQVVQQNGSVPSPVVVNTPSEIATGGARAEELEGVLVRINNVTVDSVTTNMQGNPEFGEVTLKSGAIVDEKFYDYFTDYQFKKSTTYNFVTGPLHFSFDTAKIAPRDQNDVDGPTKSP